MALEYPTLDGKTQALMILRNLDRFYFATIGLLGLTLAIISLAKRGSRKYGILAILFSLISIAITFLDTWKLLI